MKELLEKKLAGLQEQEAKALANYQAVRGARQFCEHLIAELSKEETSPSESQ